VVTAKVGGRFYKAKKEQAPRVRIVLERDGVRIDKCGIS